MKWSRGILGDIIYLGSHTIYQQSVSVLAAMVMDTRAFEDSAASDSSADESRPLTSTPYKRPLSESAVGQALGCSVLCLGSDVSGEEGGDSDDSFFEANTDPTLG